MSALERALEWLRPLVETKAWDFSVVWKLGDDPSRFIEWMGCCCGGGKGDCNNVKEESGGEKILIPLCRDAYIQHPVRTKACETLAKLPFSIPLYSGIHREVTISNQPRWLSHANASKSNHSAESTGTQVLIPVVGGLIELFSGKQVPKDQKLIEFIMSQCNIFMEHELTTAQSDNNLSLVENPRDPFLEEYLNNCPTSPISYPSFRGLSTCLNPSNEHQSLKSGFGHVSQMSPSQSIGKCHPSLKSGFGHVVNLSTKQEFESVLKARHGTKREHYRSKNLVTERNRRTRIKDGLFALRALVPKISKMDRASIVVDAIEYIEELQKKVKKFQDELKELAEKDCNKNNAELEVSEQKRGTSHSLAPSSGDEKKQREVQVEVSEIGTRDLLVELIHYQERGGFVKLMEALNSLGLQVIDANITTFNGRVLNIVRVEANRKEVEPRNLRDTLTKLTS